MLELNKIKLGILAKVVLLLRTPTMAETLRWQAGKGEPVNERTIINLPRVIFIRIHKIAIL